MTPRSILITGTDTGAGKTHTAALWLAALRATGVDAAYWKPAETGVPPRSQPLWRAGVADGGDCGHVAAVAGSDAPVYGGIRLSDALAPAVAAARAGTPLDVQALVAAGSTLAARHGLLLFEGAGGLAVELAPGYDYRRLARDLGAGVVLVVANRLGCLNHAVLTWEAAAAAGLQCLGWILNELTAAAVDSARALNPRELERLLGMPPLAHVPFAATTQVFATLV